MIAKKVLLVDDDEALCKSLGFLLERGGYAVQATADSYEGERFLRSNVYDAAVVDYNMPGLNGIDLLRASKQAAPATKFLLITGKPEIREMLQKESVAADAVVMKPFDCKTLLNKLKELLPE